ncbi:MAG: 3-oxoacyl-ACP reductase FabG [Chloroflexi bacterium]|nr:MAG: 3-oxoacyl-ACP reductase FabG [Chloroflexota bacterium]
MNERRLDGKVAIVTGSSRGIGKAIAERYAEEGAKVTVNWAGRERDAKAVVDGIESRGGEALSVGADVSSSADVKKLVRATMDHFGRIDILVNNAGVMVGKSVLETTEDDWDRTIDVNLKGAYLCSKEVATIMLGQEAGKIIMMSSNSGLYHPSAMKFTEYVVSKAGMNGLTKALALALGPHITVNAICPGWIKTDMIADTDPEIERRILDETALRRWGTTDDVAGAAVFLASSEADFITGELLIVATDQRSRRRSRARRAHGGHCGRRRCGPGPQLRRLRRWPKPVRMR